MYYVYRAAPRQDLRDKIPHIDPDLLRKRLMGFIAERHPSLQKRFATLVKQALVDAMVKEEIGQDNLSGKYSLDWTGPSFTVVRKEAQSV